MRHSLTSLQERLSNTVTEMRAQAQEMEKLKEAIQSKAGPLKLAQTRLNMRTQKIRRFDIIIVTIQVQVQSPKSKGLGVTLFCCCTTHPTRQFDSN